MSDELRDRIAEAIVTVDDGEVYRTGHVATPEQVAQAIIDEFGLHYVDSEEYARVGLDWIEVEKGRHVVGKWEKQ